MSKWLLVALGLLAAASLPAQQRRMGGDGRNYGLGFGNVVFPGGFRPVVPPVTYPANGSFAQRLGATVGGIPYTGAPGRIGRFNYGNRGYGGAAVIPYYIGGWGYDYAPSGESAAPNVTVIVQPPAGAPQGSTVFNQNYMPNSIRPEDTGGDAAPTSPSAGMRTYEAPLPYRPEGPEEPAPARSRPAPAASANRGAADVMDQKATIYLVAFKDQTIQAAYACWVEGNILHYVTVQGSHNRATLDLIDRDLSDRLNRERGIDFPLAHAR